MIKPTSAMADLMEKYGYANGQAMIQAEGLEGVLAILKNETGGNVDAMGELFGSTEALTAVLALTGDSYTDFINKSKEMENSLGATNKALEKVSATSSDKLKVKMNELKNSFLDCGEALLPLVDEFSNGVTSLTQFIKKLDPEMVKNIAKWSAMSLGIGIATKATGGFVSSIGSITGGLSKLVGWLGKTTTATSGLGTTASTVASGGISTLVGGLGGLSSIVAPLGLAIGAVGGAMYIASEASDVWNGNILKSTESMSLAEKVIAKLSGVTTHSKTELEDMGYKFKEFEGITPSVADGLELVAEKTRSLNLAIDEVNFDGVISEEDVTHIQIKTQDWCNTIIKTIKGNDSEVNKAIGDLFGADGVVTESEQRVLEILGKTNDEKVKIVEEANTKINEIIANAKIEERNITQEENNIILEEINKANQAVLDSYNLTEEERLASQNLFLQKCNGQSLESLSKELEIERKAMEERKQIVHEKYDAGIEALRASIPQLEGAARELAEAELNAQIAQKDKLLENENKKWMDIIGVCDTEYSNYMGLINKYSGDILTNQDLDTQKQLEGMKNRYDNINAITDSGLYSVWDSTKKQYDSVRVVVDENTGEIIGLHSMLYNDTAGYTDKIRKDLAVTSMEYNLDMANIKTSLRDWKTATVNESGQVIDANGNIIGSISDMEKKIKDTTGKTIKINVDNGVITNLDNIYNKLDSVNRFKISDKYVNVHYKSSGGNTHSAYALGGISNNSQIATTNEKGFELFDNISSYSAKATRAIDGELSALASNTRVSNNLMSTAKMNQEISMQVDNKISRAIGEAISKLSKEQTEESLGDITFNNVFNVENNTDFDVKQFEFNVTKELKKELNKVGIKIR